MQIHLIARMWKIIHCALRTNKMILHDEQQRAQDGIIWHWETDFPHPVEILSFLITGIKVWVFHCWNSPCSFSSPHFSTEIVCLRDKKYERGGRVAELRKTFADAHVPSDSTETPSPRRAATTHRGRAPLVHWDWVGDKTGLSDMSLEQEHVTSHTGWDTLFSIQDPVRQKTARQPWTNWGYTTRVSCKMQKGAGTKPRWRG